MSHHPTPPPRARRTLAAVACLALAATAGCASRSTTTRTATGDVALRWSATIAPVAATPAIVPHVTGRAVLSPASGEEQSVAVLSLESAPGAGATLAWRLVRGGCEGTGVVLGDPSDYPFVQLRADGTGQATATLPLDVPSSGRLSVRIYASPARTDAPIACGALQQGML